MKTGHDYRVRLVGTKNYDICHQAILSGDEVRILREIGNPFDENALVAVDRRGRTLGYVPRSSWLRKAIIDEGSGCNAFVELVDLEIGGVSNVVIVVNDSKAPIGTREYVSAD